MELFYTNVALIGYGRVGQAISSMLSQHGFQITAYDAREIVGANQLPKNQDGSIDYSVAVSKADCVITATPFTCNFAIAQECIRQSKAYFDLTEDVATTEAIVAAAETHAQQGNVVWVSPQCGLAPGAVGMIASHIVDTFEEIHDVKLRVGALPRSASNAIKYYLTWSSEGLVNEYINPCRIINEGVAREVPALDGYEILTIDGEEYEAFYTSGGVGSLLKKLEGKVKNVDYKTIRYKGHHSMMSFLLHDLGLRYKPDLAVELLNNGVPQTTNDVVVIYVEVTGRKNGVYKTETYHRKIYGDNKFTAIQRATAAGVCTVVHYWAMSSFPARNGFAPCEDISEISLNHNPFWKVYAD